MLEDFVVARNPEPDSKLPYLLRVPLGRDGIILKSRETWPRTSKVYCHRIEEWPEDPDVVERVPTRSCVRRGASIDLVLDRARENRSQFTRIRGGRAAIFWQTARTNKQARPAVTVPSARAAGIVELEVVVDSHERYPYTFKDQQVVTRRAPLAAGDYAVELGGALLASVERKTLEDLVSSLTSGKLKYQLSDLAAVPRAALVVEDRYCRCSGRPTCDPRPSPTGSPSASSPGPVCRSCSSRPARSPRSGPTASWRRHAPRPSSSTAVGWPCASLRRPDRSSPPRRPRPRCVPGL